MHYPQPPALERVGPVVLTTLCRVGDAALDLIITKRQFPSYDLATFYLEREMQKVWPLLVNYAITTYNGTLYAEFKGDHYIAHD